MATVQISDIYEPETFDTTIDEKAIELNAFAASGVVVEDPALSTQASAGGRIGEVTNFPALTQTEPNISSDDPAETSTPENISKKVQIWRLAALNQSWSTMDLSRDLALKDPVTAVTSKIAQYWATEQEKRIIQSTMGLLADNVADDSGDMVVNVATDDAGAITADELISPDIVMDAQQTLGDHMGNITVIAMHSVVFTSLKKQNVIDYIPASDSQILIPYYLGMRVVVDDSMSAIAGTNRITYTSALFGTGVFGHGSGKVLMPTEVERLPATGNGAGQEVIYSRQSDIYHPWGTSFLSASVADESATLAELADADNWNRIYDRKNLPLAFLQTNG